ncbi:MAG: EscU/YscU/HrcU family type III secretion system export apparatus switch protein, partial [Planctomycetota bacterium]
MSGEKKHAATPRRREKARQEGQVVRSQDLSSALLLLIALAVLYYWGSSIAGALAQMISGALRNVDMTPLATDSAAHHMTGHAMPLILNLIPVFVAMLLAGIAVNLGQTGLVFSPQRITPKLSHINPLSGAGRIASIRGSMRLAFGLFKVAIVVVVAITSIYLHGEQLLALATLSLPQIASGVFGTLIGTCFWVAGALVILAIGEYAFQRWKHEQDLMMTDQELRDELKETEGDPQLAMRRKQVQRQMVNQRILTAVPAADVVVTNPTELAVALRYDPETMAAPVVVAKGAGSLASGFRSTIGTLFSNAILR